MACLSRPKVPDSVYKQGAGDCLHVWPVTPVWQFLQVRVKEAVKRPAGHPRAAGPTDLPVAQSQAKDSARSDHSSCGNTLEGHDRALHDGKMVVRSKASEVAVDDH